MSDKEKDMQDDDFIVEMEDEQGNKYYYQEEMIIPVGDQRYALLVGIPSEDEHGHEHGCGCGCEDDEDVLIAKIIINDEGEEEYVEPTDEEFEAVQKAYDALVEESEKE